MFKRKKQKDSAVNVDSTVDSEQQTPPPNSATDSGSNVTTDSNSTTEHPLDWIDGTQGNKVLGNTFIKRVINNTYIKVREDYIEYPNGSVGAVVLVYDNSGKSIDLDPQWGIEFIRGLVNDTKRMKDININFITTIQLLSPKQTERKQDDADRATVNQGNDQNKRKRQTSMRARQRDLDIIAAELDGSSKYLVAGLKYVISAVSIEVLDEVIDEMQRRLRLRLPGVNLSLPYDGALSSFSKIFDKPESQKGRKLMFTTAEFAGSYNLVTQGINDPTGVYVGEQLGDINNTAVVWDMSNFKERAILAIKNKRAATLYERTQISSVLSPTASGCDLWYNALVNQLCISDTGQIITFALTDVELSNRLYSLTNVMDLSKGGINPIEMFGSVENELNVYSANLQKWATMTQQLNEKQVTLNKTADDLSQEELTALTEELNRFYIESNVWSLDPTHRREELRVVNVPHEEIGRLRTLVDYLESAERRYQRNGDNARAAHMRRLLAIYTNVLNTASDLFDGQTIPEFDRVTASRHTLFAYGNLEHRGTNILLAQLINTFEAIVHQTKEGDTIIFYGADVIDSITEEYLRQMLNRLYERSVKVVFMYRSVETMLKRQKLNKMSSADWVLTGYMSGDEVTDYNNALGSIGNMTDNIARSIQMTSDNRYYLRRGSENIVFGADPTI